MLFRSANVPAFEYNERLVIIEKARNMIYKLSKRIELQFHAGIGSVQAMDQMYTSYKEACQALKNLKGSVTHIKDFVPNQTLDKNYPIEIENSMFQYLKKGNLTGVIAEANNFYDWMAENYADCISDIQLKVLELAMYAERLAFYDGGMSYYFTDRADYLEEVLACKDLNVLQNWFLDKLKHATENVLGKEGKQYSSLDRKSVV